MQVAALFVYYALLCLVGMLGPVLVLGMCWPELFDHRACVGLSNPVPIPRWVDFLAWLGGGVGFSIAWLLRRRLTRRT